MYKLSPPALLPPVELRLRTMLARDPRGLRSRTVLSALRAPVVTLIRRIARALPVLVRRFTARWLRPQLLQLAVIAARPPPGTL